MQKTLFLALFAIFFSSNVYAKHDGMCSGCRKGGFFDADTPSMSVAEVQKMAADSFVTMQGQILKRVGKDKYYFSDGKNEMVVEIDDKVWQGQTVSPKDKVVISGEVDKDNGQQIIDVKSLMLMSK